MHEHFLVVVSKKASAPSHNSSVSAISPISVKEARQNKKGYNSVSCEQFSIYPLYIDHFSGSILFGIGTLLVYKQNVENYRTGHFQ